MTEERHASLWLSLVVLEASGSDGARRVLRLLRDVRWAVECGPGCLLMRYMQCMETVVRASATPLSPGRFRRRCSSQTTSNRSPSASSALQTVPRDVLSWAWKRVWSEDSPRRRTLSASTTPHCTPCGTPRGTPSETPPRGTPRGTPRVSLSPHMEGRRATWGPATEEALAVAKAWGCIGNFRRRRASCFASPPGCPEHEDDDSNEGREKEVVALAWGCLSPEPTPGNRRRANVSLSDKGLSILLPLAEWAQEAHKQHCAGNKCYRRFTDGTILARSATEDDELERASRDSTRGRCNSM